MGSICIHHRPACWTIVQVYAITHVILPVLTLSFEGCGTSAAATCMWDAWHLQKCCHVLNMHATFHGMIDLQTELKFRVILLWVIVHSVVICVLPPMMNSQRE